MSCRAAWLHVSHDSPKGREDVEHLLPLCLSPLGVAGPFKIQYNRGEDKKNDAWTVNLFTWEGNIVTELALFVKCVPTICVSSSSDTEALEASF